MNQAIIERTNTTSTPKSKVLKKLYAAIALLLVATLLMSGTTFAWIVLSTAPEATEITTTVGANGALEIKLNLTNAADDDKNNIFRNIVEFANKEYGLDKIILRPAMPSYDFDSGFLQIPEYDYDGLIKNEFVGAGSYVGTLGEDGEFYQSDDDTGVRVVGTASGTTPRQSAFDSAIRAAKNAISLAKSNAQSSLKNDKFQGIVIKMVSSNSNYNTEDVDVLNTMIAGLESSVTKLEEAYKQLIFAFAASDSVQDENAYSLIQTLWGTNGLTLENIAAEGKIVVGDHSVSVNAEVLSGIRALQTTKGNVQAARDAYDELDRDDDAFTSDEISPILTKLVDRSKILVNGDDPGNVDVNDVLANGATVTMQDGAGVYVEIADQIGNYSVAISKTVTMQTQTAVTKPYLTNSLSTVEGIGAPGGNIAELPMNIQVGYILDFSFKTNAKNSHLLLQTEAIDRVNQENSTEATMGGGSFMKFRITEGADITTKQVTQIMSCFRIVFFDTDTKDVLGNASLDTSYINGSDGSVKASIIMANEDGSDVIASLPHNTPRNISVLVYLDAKELENEHVSATTASSVTGVMNLQFASDADLVPAY